MAKGRVFCYVTTDSWRVTVHCALLTMVSHTSWSHYSKVFFVKGKGGKRASRLSLAGCGRAPTRASRSSEETTEIDTEKKRNEREREPRHQHEHKHKKKRRAWAPAGQDTRNKNWRQGQSWTRTQTPSRKHNILVAIRSLVLQFCSFFEFFGLLKISANAESVETWKIMNSHFAFREKSGQLETSKFINTIKLENARNQKTQKFLDL